MPIPANKDLIRPARPEKQYSEEWTSEFVIQFPNPEQGRLSIKTIAYDPEEGETNPDIVGTQLVADLAPLARKLPKVQKILDSIDDAIPDIVEFIEKENEKKAQKAVR